MTKIDSNKIHLLNITITESSIEDKSFGIEPDDFDFSIESNHAFNEKENFIKIEFLITINGEYKENDECSLKATFQLTYVFGIDNFEELFNKDTMAIDNRLGITVTSIAYSSSRGIIFEKLRGTFLANFILPVIRPADLMEF